MTAESHSWTAAFEEKAQLPSAAGAQLRAAVLEEQTKARLPVFEAEPEFSACCPGGGQAGQFSTFAGGVAFSEERTRGGGKGAGSSSSGGLGGAFVNRSTGRGLKGGSAGGGPGRGRRDFNAGGAFASSRPEDGGVPGSPLTIWLTNEAAKMSESSGQDTSHTRMPAKPHVKNGWITSKWEPPRLKRKVTWEKSLPTSSDADGSKTRLLALSLSSSSDSSGRPTKKTGILSDVELSSRASRHVLGSLLTNIPTLPPTSSHRLNGLW